MRLGHLDARGWYGMHGDVFDSSSTNKIYFSWLQMDAVVAGIVV